MKNTTVVIGLLIVLLILIGFALVKRDLFMPAQVNTAAMKKDTIVKPSSTMEPATTITLATQNDSGQSGTATLTEENGKVTVSIHLTGGTFTQPQPAHIHIGTCENPGKIVYPLTSVVNGSSETILEVPMSQLKSQLPLVVNIHKSATEPKVYTACGDLK